MMTEEDMTTRDIARWYHKHGIPYERDDWGPRGETGESEGEQMQRPEQAYSASDRGSNNVRSTDATPGNMWWWEGKPFPWRQRTHSERAWIAALEGFFTPYLAMLPRPKGNLIREVFNDTKTYQEVADDNHMARQSAHEAVQRAVQDLTKLIAKDDVLYRPPADGRRRDYEAENRAARRVFILYLHARDAADE